MLTQEAVDTLKLHMSRMHRRGESRWAVTQVSKNYLILASILDLAAAQHLQGDLRAAVRPFYKKLYQDDQGILKNIEDEAEKFADKIIEVAEQIKKAEAEDPIKEEEEPAPEAPGQEDEPELQAVHPSDPVFAKPFPADLSRSFVRVWTKKDGVAGHDLCLEAKGFVADARLVEMNVKVEFTCKVKDLVVKGSAEGQDKVTPLKSDWVTDILTNVSHKVFEADKHPEIVFKGEGQLRTDSMELKMVGSLSMHWQTKEFTFSTEVGGTATHVTVDGKVPIVQSEFGITPFSAAAGGIKVQDEVVLSWHVEYKRPEV